MSSIPQEPQQKTVEMRFSLPEAVHTRLRMVAVKRGLTHSQLIEELLNENLPTFEVGATTNAA